jgi:hypothetical protein
MGRSIRLYCCLILSLCILGYIFGCNVNDPKYPLNISIKNTNEFSNNPTLIWKSQHELAFKELARMTIFVFNPESKRINFMVLIKDMNKRNLTQDDQIVDLGKLNPGEYEVWIGLQTDNKQLSNKCTFTVK